MAIECCSHGYGGFFTCPQGCHSQRPVADHEALDANIDYFFKRLEAHGMDVNPITKKDNSK